jgi:hypothetical protein
MAQPPEIIIVSGNIHVRRFMQILIVNISRQQANLSKTVLSLSVPQFIIDPAATGLRKGQAFRP